MYLLEKHLHPDTPESKPVELMPLDTFNRGPDVILADDSISRAHAMLFFEENGFGLIDLASTNGSRVNQAQVTSVILEDGDSITLGTTELALSIPA